MLSFWVIAGAQCWSVKYERAYCLLWRLLVPYQRMRTRTGVPKMSYGKCWVCARVMTGDSQTMEGKVTCDGCGWVSSKDGSY